MNFRTEISFLSLLLLFFVPSQEILSQISLQHRCSHDESCRGLQAIYENMNTTVAPPAGFDFGGERDVVISVTYNGFSTEAQLAFQYAVDIWASILTSSVPIMVDATWEDLPGNTLGYAGANLNYYNFSNAPQSNVFYPSPLADKLAGFDLDPGSPDIVASFDSGSDWYFGLDGNPPSGTFDFVSVVLHELGHGVGVLGSADYDAGMGFMGLGIGYPTVYDGFIQNNVGTSILDFSNGSTALGDALTGGNLLWNGTQAVANNFDVLPDIYAPSSWEPGSSYSHLDEQTYTAGSVNSLMTPLIGYAEANHNPGPIVLGLLEDIGWTVTDLQGCDAVEAYFSFTTDCWSGESSWSIEDAAGNVFYSSNAALAQETTVITPLCLPEGCYILNVNDSFGDGLDGLNTGCSMNGDYALTDAQGNVLVQMDVPNFGLGIQHDFCLNATSCQFDDVSITQGDCDGNIPSIHLNFSISGSCTVNDICVSEDGADFICQDISALNIGDGGGIAFNSSIPDVLYQFYFVLSDGTVSTTSDFLNGNCDVVETICDCAGTAHTVGVLSWLGDGFPDDSGFMWEGQPVDFNCATWGYDCGDIQDAPSGDPFNICGGQLPPGNGCGEIFGCTDSTALNFNTLATFDDQSCIYNCILPGIEFTSFCIEGDLSGFYVEVDILSLGNGAPYTLENDQNNTQEVVDNTNFMELGPFTNADDLVFSVYSNTLDGCVLTSSILNDNCDPDFIGMHEFMAPQVFPNPSNGLLTLFTGDLEGVLSLEVVNLTGKKVLTRVMTTQRNQTVELDLSLLSSGSYFLVLSSENKMSRLKIIIN